MTALWTRLRWPVPDLEPTVRRFPFAVALLIGLTGLVIALLNEWIGYRDEDPWFRLASGLAVASVAATAGHLFAEGRPRRTPVTLLLEFALPVAIVALYQVQDEVLLIMPAGAVLLWLSVSLSLAGPKGQGADLFWWSNSRALPSAAVAIVAAALIVGGCLLIDWSLSRLFAFELSWLIERWLLPVVCLLLVPLYWLSTVPRAQDFHPGALSPDDFLVRAVGLIGQFVLIPFTLAYAAILHVYAVQIAVSGAMPDGVIGPLVLYFQIAGLVTWILVHPVFLRDRPLVRLFRRIWFLASIVPLALFAYAVWLRFDAYGVTPRRFILIAFGLWGIAICVTFLIKRGAADIRLIPGGAALVLAMTSYGPLAPDTVSRWHQSIRFETAFAGVTAGEGLDWSPGQRERARSAFDYLLRDGRADDWLGAVLERNGIAIPDGGLRDAQLRTALGFGHDDPWFSRTLILRADLAANPVDLRETPFARGALWISNRPVPVEGTDIVLAQSGNVLTARRDGELVAEIDLSAWLSRQADGRLADPVIDVPIGTATLRLLVDNLYYASNAERESDIEGTIETISAMIFSDRSAL